MNSHLIATSHQDAEFNKLFLEYFDHEQSVPAYQSFGQRDSNHTLQLILREYLRDFWRHSTEKDGKTL